MHKLTAAEQEAVQAVLAWVEAGMPRHINFNGQPARAASAALYAALQAARKDKENVFWRGTNRKEERADMAQGVAIRSKHHGFGVAEKGLSVATTLATIWSYGYQYAYKVTGEVVGEGSDGEPVIINARPVSRLLRAKDAIEQDKSQTRVATTINKIAEAVHLSPEKILWLAYE